MMLEIKNQMEIQRAGMRAGAVEKLAISNWDKKRGSRVKQDGLGDSQVDS
jgi:hypothetical protein